ncbi:MAG: type II secretion system F family protein [Patescibacteria group bacterium]
MAVKKAAPAVNINLSRSERFKLWATVRMSHTEKLSFSKYLSVLLQSGLAIDEVLKILLEQSKGALKHIVTTLKESVENGKTLAEGFARYPHLFSPVFINLVAAGEASGTLVTNLGHLMEQMQKDHDLRQKIRGAVMYPSIILLFAIILCVGIVVFILPNITDVFKSLDVELPITTRLLLWTADLVRYHGPVLALSIVGVIVALLVARKLPFIKPVWHAVFLRIPILGPLARKTSLARLTRLMGTMLKSGVTIDDVIPIAKNVLSNVRYVSAMTQIQLEISQGKTLSESFGKYHVLFPALFVRMTRVGEESGSLGDTFLYLATFYEEDISDATKNLSTLLEPLLLVGIGLMVGTVALSIISPIYAVVGEI